jgi:hypothetical protein
MKAKINIPKYESFPEFQIEMDKMTKLKNSLQAFKDKKNDMSLVNSEHTASMRLRGENIESLIESGEFNETGTGAKYTADDFAQINSQVHMLEQAIEKHQVTIDKTKNLVHPKQLKDVRAKYAVLVKKITDAYSMVAELHDEENQIIQALDAEDIKYWGVMPRIHTSNIGYLSNEYAWFHFYLREAEQQGYIKAKDYL